MLKSMFKYLAVSSVFTLAASAGKPASCTDQQVTVVLSASTGGPGLFGDGLAGNEYSGTVMTCSNNDLVVDVSGTARSFTVNLSGIIAGAGLPTWMQAGSYSVQGYFKVSGVVSGENTTSAMWFYFKGPDRKQYLIQFNNPCISTRPRTIDPATINTPYLTSKIVVAAGSGAWVIYPDTAADSCTISQTTFTNSEVQRPVGTLMAVGTKAQFINIGQVTFPFNLTVTVTK